MIIRICHTFCIHIRVPKLRFWVTSRGPEALEISGKLVGTISTYPGMSPMPSQRGVAKTLGRDIGI